MAGNHVVVCDRDRAWYQVGRADIKWEELVGRAAAAAAAAAAPPKLYS
jgi:hypothetical protein